MKRTQNGELVMSKEEFTNAQKNAYLDGAIAMVDSMKESIMVRVGRDDAVLIEKLNTLFNKSKEELINAKTNR